MNYIKTQLEQQEPVQSNQSELQEEEEEEDYFDIMKDIVQVTSKQLNVHLASTDTTMDVLKSVPAVYRLLLKVNTPLLASAVCERLFSSAGHIFTPKRALTFLGFINVIFTSNRYLLENGADPNIQDKTGKTALIHACIEQTGAEILLLLLSSGADPTLEDHAGLSALVYAVNSGNRDILRLLLDACKAKGKEVIIITTNKLPSGHQMTKQYLNVPPPPDLEEHLHYTPTSCCLSPYPPPTSQGFTAAASLQPVSPLLGFKDPQYLVSRPGLDPSQSGSPIQHPSPLCVPGVDKQLNHLYSEQWSKSPCLLFQQSQASSLTEEPVEITPEEEQSFIVNGLTFHRRPPAVSRHNSINVKDETGLLKALENMSVNENRGGGGRRGFGRKMSYDSAASLQHSASHPNLHQSSLPFPHESSPVDKDSSDCLREFNVYSLQNVVHLQNIGIDHYSSDSQLPQFGSRDNSSKKIGGVKVEAEKHKLSHRSSALSGSRESLDGSVQRRSIARLERRASGAIISDHIAHARPGYLPPLNPHAPIPNIGVNSSSFYPFCRSSKTLNQIESGSKLFFLVHLFSLGI
ncbi:ankyrin repeat domain 34Bb [Etheostoma cragini]|uniref:ankyrin repeat domain 34Bb n=1 Tax=Etheostoma cragini TaxID=417921 RepID=UPI00155E9807|nr:ankyrin repeat domain 34Bb [Etheostoma cragini]